MLIVQAPLRWAPAYCAASMRLEDPEGFFDTGNSLPLCDPRIYVSVSWVRDRARDLGYLHADDETVLRQDLERARTERDEALRELEEARAALAAVHVLKRAGFDSQRKPGRKAAV